MQKKHWTKCLKSANNMDVDQLIECALEEDVGSGDITTEAILNKNDEIIEAVIVSRQKGVVCGLHIAKKTFHKLDSNIDFKGLVKEGEVVVKDQKIAKIHGSAKAILAAERVALNFLQRTSGVATYTAEFVKKCRGKAILLDTRKTLPCMRELDKYAVKCGGGQNHRMGLYDMILIKDNHINIAGSVTNALMLAKKHEGKKKIEIEVETLEEVKEVLEVGCDIIMLDNMSLDKIKKAVKLIDRKIKTEVSGGVTLENISKLAETGVDFISVGAITHSAKAFDFSLEFR